MALGAHPAFSTRSIDCISGLLAVGPAVGVRSPVEDSAARGGRLGGLVAAASAQTIAASVAACTTVRAAVSRSKVSNTQARAARSPVWVRWEKLTGAATAVTSRCPTVSPAAMASARR